MSSSRSMCRPQGNGPFTSEEIDYTCALNDAKKRFLARVGSELQDMYPHLRTRIEPYGDSEGQLGYRLVVQRPLSGLRRKIGLAAIGCYDRDLTFAATNSAVIDAITTLAPFLEDEVLALDSNSKMEPMKVYVHGRNKFVSDTVDEVNDAVAGRLSLAGARGGELSLDSESGKLSLKD